MVGRGWPCLLACEMGNRMAHNKNRSDYNVGNVDWSDPQLNELLQKIDGLSLDQRGNMSPRQVQVRIATGWDASESDKSALLVAEIDGTLVLATRFPLPRGGEVQVSGVHGDAAETLFAVVTEEREGCRSEDRDEGVHFSWLRPR